MKEQEDTQVALLLRNAYAWKMATNKTVIVTANGHITLAPAENVETALQFTLEQWNRVVEFVECQLLLPDPDGVSL